MKLGSSFGSFTIITSPYLLADWAADRMAARISLRATAVLTCLLGVQPAHGLGRIHQQVTQVPAETEAHGVLLDAGTQVAICVAKRSRLPIAEHLHDLHEVHVRDPVGK